MNPGENTFKTQEATNELSADTLEYYRQQMTGLATQQSGYAQSYVPYTHPAPCPTCGHCPTCGRSNGSGYHATPIWTVGTSQPILMK